MKKIITLIILIQTVFSIQAQNIPYEKLEELSMLISKLQFEANGLSYENGLNKFEISFPVENFVAAFNSQLATNAVYKKSKDRELMYLTENISLGRVVGFTSEVMDNNLIVWKINFGKFYVTTQVFDEGKLIDTTYKNELILYSLYNVNKKSTDPTFFNSFSELCNTVKRRIEMISDKELESENKDWKDKNITRTDFIKKHPNSIRTMQAKMIVENMLAKEKYKVQRTIVFMDSIAQSFKIKIGMSEIEYKQQNPEIAEEIFKKKNSYTSDDGNYKSYSSRKKFPQIESLIFKHEKLANHCYYVRLNSISGRVEEFNKYVALVRANLAPKYFNVTESVHHIGITHPTDNWTLIIDYRPDLDAYSSGINLRFFFSDKD